MDKRFGRVAILGLGLIGGSLGLALRARDLAEDIAGYDVLPGGTERASGRGAITDVAATPAEAARGAELVVLAAPVGAIPELLAEVAPALGVAALVTDTGSVKRPICTAAAELLPDPARFVGGHPMAGREQSGIEAADPTLFEGALWCLTPDHTTDGAAVSRMEALVRALGATPRTLDADRHDVLVGGASHLPLAAATALVATIAADPAGPEALELAAGGFRDTTRVASGDPIMARDIMLANADNIAAWLSAYVKALEQLRALILAGDASGIERAFANAKAARDAWLARRSPDHGPPV